MPAPLIARCNALPAPPRTPDDATLIALRVLQGIGGAATLALTLSIITETSPAAHRAAGIDVFVLSQWVMAARSA